MALAFEIPAKLSPDQCGDHPSSATWPLSFDLHEDMDSATGVASH